MKKNIIKNGVKNLYNKKGKINNFCQNVLHNKDLLKARLKALKIRGIQKSNHQQFKNNYSKKNLIYFNK